MEKRIRNALGDFYNSPHFLEKLAAMMVFLKEDEHDYASEFLLEQINLNDQFKSFKKNMRERFIERILQTDHDELASTANFILLNTTIAPLVVEESEHIMQDFFLRLQTVNQINQSLAKALVFYGVSYAMFDWRDRHLSIPYDEEIHGPIRLAIVDSD